MKKSCVLQFASFLVLIVLLVTTSVNNHTALRSAAKDGAGQAIRVLGFDGSPQPWPWLW